MNSLTLRPQFQYHSQHLVEQSPWPFYISMTLGMSGIGAAASFHGYGATTLLIGLLLTLVVMTLWLRDVVIEGTFQGHHLPSVQNGIFLGFILFIVSEIFAFFSIFWAFFHSALSPDIVLGQMWPPVGIDALDPFGLPLLNTILLLSSGAFLTIAHHGVAKGDRALTINAFFITVLLAVLFIGCQGFEYYQAPFTFSDSVFGNAFFASTGLHGLHIFIGLIFLLAAFARIINYNMTDSHMIGFEVSAIYWHFVDVVWLFLWLIVYYWPTI